MESKILGLLRTTALAAGLSMMASFGAHAITITSTQLTIDALNSMTPQANSLATFTTGTVYQNFTGSVVNVRRSPWQGSAYDQTGQYTSVSANATATYDFGSLQSSFSLIWGSPDNYNDLYIRLMAGDQIVETVTINGVQAQPPIRIGASYLTVSGVTFNRLVFSSRTTNAFEFANLRVPEPGSLALLGLGLLGLGLTRRRKT